MGIRWLIEVAVLAVACVLPCDADGFTLLPSDTLSSSPPSFIRFVAPDDSISLSDDDFYLHAVKILFPLDSYAIPTDAAVLSELSSSIIPALKRDSVRLLRIWMSGAASPDGSYASNVRLSRKRAKSLLAFLNTQLDTPVDASVITIKDHDVEGYRMLLWLMRRASDPAYGEVSRLVDAFLADGSNEELKRRLIALHGGALWQRLLRDYFPQLRAARIMLWFSKPLRERPLSGVSVQEREAVAEEAHVEWPLHGVTVPEAGALPGQAAVPRRAVLSVKTNVLLDAAWMPGYQRWCPIPNVGVEYYPRRGHFTYGASIDFPWWKHYESHKFFEARNYQIETRYYLGRRRAHGAYEAHEAYGAYRAHGAYGFFLQGYLHANLFEIGFNADKGWKGEGLGAGLGVGYVVALGRAAAGSRGLRSGSGGGDGAVAGSRWRIEFSLQVGWYTCRYDPFQYENLVNPDYHDGLYYYRWTGEAGDFRKRQHRFNWFGPTRVGITLCYDLLYRRGQKRGVSFRCTEERRVEP